MTITVSDKKPLLSNLEALRGICALMVALLHVPWTNHLLFLPIVHNAWLFVGFFFILSGFIIALNYITQDSDTFNARNFMIKRLFRLYPLHIFTLVLMLAVEVVREYLVPLVTAIQPRGTFDDSFAEALGLNIFLLHATGLTDKNILNVPSWSISTEFWTYVLFAFICTVAIKPMIRVALVVMAGLLGGIVFIWLNGQNGLATPLQYNWPRCIMSFGLGTIVWLAYARSRAFPGRSLLHLVYLILFLGILNLMALSTRTSPLNFSLLPLFAVVIYLFAVDSGSMVKAFMETPPMQKIGGWSYSIYMVHAFWSGVCGFALNRFYSGKTTIIEMGNRLEVPLYLGDVAILIYLALVLATARLTYQFIEAPWRRIGRNLVDRRAGVKAVTRNVPKPGVRVD